MVGLESSKSCTLMGLANGSIGRVSEPVEGFFTTSVNETLAEANSSRMLIGCAEGIGLSGGLLVVVMTLIEERG